MADQLNSVGHNLPRPNQSSLDQASRYLNLGNSNPSDISFKGVLDRSQLTSSQLKAMQAPSMRTPVARTSFKPSASSNSIQSGKVATSSKPNLIQSPNDISVELLNHPQLGSQPAVQSAPSSTPQLGGIRVDPQLAEMFRDVPGGVPASDTFNQRVMQNIAALNARKQLQVQSQPVAQIPNQPATVSTSQVAGAVSQRGQMRNAFGSMASAPSNPTMPSIQDSMSPVRAFNRALSSDFHGPNGSSTMQIQPGSAVTISSSAGLLPATISQQSGQVNQAFQPAQNSQVLHHSDLLALDGFVESTGETQPHKGPVKAFGSFFTNLASGLSFGLIRPKGEAAPEGLGRIAYPFKKVLWDAPKSIVVDVPVGAYHALGNRYRSTEEEPQLAEAETPKRRSRMIVSMRRGNFYT